jgi:predicted acyltransferase
VTQLNQSRYLSLDVFRGMDVMLMIIVNSPGGPLNWSPLNHAQWNGFTLTDLVFPTFLFVVGNAMSFSMGKYESMGNGAVFTKIFKRTALIFLIGYLSYWFPFVQQNDAGEWMMKPISHTRIFGVLQRIALCYGFAALIIHFWKVKGALYFCLFALIAYRLIMAAFGDWSLEGNAGSRLDMWLVGADHLYKGEGVPFDPEGLLSTLPAIVNVIAGYVAGRFIQQNGQNYETIAKLMMAGAVLVLCSLWWDLFFPINKKLWTSSYVLLTVGIDLLILPVLIFLIDMAGKKNWTYPFVVFGRNTLFIYLLSEVFVITLWTISVGDQSLYGWIYSSIFNPAFGDYLGSFLFAFWVMATCWLVGWIMDKKGIYVKV